MRSFVKFLLLCGTLLGLSAGCGMDEGSSGEIPEVDVFLMEQGSLENADPVVFPVTIPYGVSLLDVTLEVLAGEADLIVGVEDPPTDFFSPGQGVGTQRILVGPSSNEPLQARTWYVELASPFRAGAQWRLSVERRLIDPGSLLLEQEGVLPAGQTVLVPVDVPEDAGSMEFVLECLLGDADLFLGFGLEEEAHASLNPGTGFEVLPLGPEIVEALRGQTVTAKIESYGQDAEFRLSVTYVAASPVVPAPAAFP